MQGSSYKYNGSIMMSLMLAGGLVGIILSVLIQNYILLLAITTIPLFLLLACYILKHPMTMYYLAFSLCYFAIAITKYFRIEGISYIVDGVVVFTIIFMLIFNNDIRELIEKTRNILLWSMIVWFIYSSFQLANSTAVAGAWVSSRGVALNGILLTILTLVSITNFKQVKTLIFILSIFTSLAIAKTFMQIYWGWDYAEIEWLNSGGAKTHLIATGIRYFSFFSDAGNFGSNMGFAIVLFSIVGFYTKKKSLRIYYIVVSLLSLYALFLSGTRGAIAVPIAGFSALAFFSRKIKLIIPLTMMLILSFMFFRYTYIGQSNQHIRRIRTAFVDGANDASFSVRLNNQKMLADYLQNKPFGVGLGLSGVENKQYANMLTTQIPHDSWYVKIWVETGIVGLVLYLLFIVGAILQAGKRLMLNVRDPMIKFYLLGWLCGIFGLLVSAYGNAFWGQFPTNIIVFSGLILAMNGKYFEKKLENVEKR